MIGAILAPIPAWADLYSAAAATEKQEFAKAFELYRELAELGQPEAQENLAVMYVNGEGVKRDNVLGYAWAAIAMENGGGEAAKGIVTQLEPHLTDSGACPRRGNPVEVRQGSVGENSCFPCVAFPANYRSAGLQHQYGFANPDNYYPREARNRRGSQGDTLVEVHWLYGDGRAHDPRSLAFVSAGVFSAWPDERRA